MAYPGRDVGFRGMPAFTEPDGTEVLYVGGVTAGSVYEPQFPQFAGGLGEAFVRRLVPRRCRRENRGEQQPQQPLPSGPSQPHL